MGRRILVAVINPGLDFTPQFFPDAALSTAYSVTLTASGGQSPYTFSVVSGSVPNGLTFTDNGDGTATLAGTPDTAGGSTLVVRIRDNNRQSRDRAYVLRVIALPLSLSLTLPDATANQAYSGTATASGGVSTYTYTKVSGPAWLTVSSAGAIGGTPAESDETASVSVIVRATDDDGSEVEATDSLAVIVLDPITIPGTFPNAVTGTAYDETLPIAGGTGTYNSAAVQTGSIADWMTLEISGTNLRLHGTPDDVGATWAFTARVTDSGANTGDSDAQSVENTGDDWTPADLSPASWTSITRNAPTTEGTSRIWDDHSGSEAWQQSPLSNAPALTTFNGIASALQFDGSNDYMSSLVSNDLFRNVGVATIGMVFHRLSDSEQVGLWVGTNTNNQARAQLRANGAVGGLGIGGRRLDSDSFTVYANANYTANDTIAILGHNKYSDATGAAYVHGAVLDTRTGAGSSGNTSNTASGNQHRLGGGSGTGGSLISAMHGIVLDTLLIARELTSDERDKWFGFTAWEYQGDASDFDFVAALDAGNPYKLGRPIKAP